MASVPQTCSRVGCTHPGIWHPVLILRPKGYEGPGARAALPLVICAEHRMTMEAEDLIAEKGWDSICETFRRLGKAEPDRESTSIAFAPVGSINFVDGGGL